MMIALLDTEIIVHPEARASFPCYSNDDHSTSMPSGVRANAPFVISCRRLHERLRQYRRNSAPMQIPQPGILNCSLSLSFNQLCAHWTQSADQAAGEQVLTLLSDVMPLCSILGSPLSLANFHP